MLQIPPESTVTTNNTPVTTTAVIADELSPAAWFSRVRTMPRTIPAASEINLWIVKMTELYGFPSLLTQKPERKMNKKNNPETNMKILALPISTPCYSYIVCHSAPQRRVSILAKFTLDSSLRFGADEAPALLSE